MLQSYSENRFAALFFIYYVIIGLDYLYWNEIERNMDITPFLTIDQFKAEIKKGCSKVSQEAIKVAVSSFNSRVRS
jgi:hypothetical protein